MKNIQLEENTCTSKEQQLVERRQERKRRTRYLGFSPPRSLAVTVTLTKFTNLAGNKFHLFIFGRRRLTWLALVRFSCLNRGQGDGAFGRFVWKCFYIQSFLVSQFWPNMLEWTEGVCLCVCLSVCLSVSTLHSKRLGRFWWNFTQIVSRTWACDNFLGFSIF